MTEPSNIERQGSRNSVLREVALLFFKIGAIGFGGPAALIALIQEEVVKRRKWMSGEHFLDLVGATNMIPGPNATEMAIHCGYHRAGWLGLIVSGICFIIPAAVISGIFAWFYAKYHTLPAAESFIYGIKPAVLVVIAGAVYELGRKALKNWLLAVIGMVVIAASLFGMNEVTVIFAGGFVGMIAIRFAQGWRIRNGLFLPLIASGGFAAQSAGVVFGNLTLTNLFLVFLKVGAVLFGSGYVLVAYLDGDLVTRLGWMTKSELLDAIAVGQFTPGPVLSAATFIGYQLLGVRGAILATAGVFLPSFIFVAILNPVIPKLRQSKWASAFLDAINISAVGLMAAVAIKIGGSVLVDWKTILIALTSFAVVFGFRKINSAFIVLGGAVLGYLLKTIEALF
jgi:chromate transporter